MDPSTLLWLLGSLVVITQLANWYGQLDQLRLTITRRSTAGLSLTDAECRVYGRLPWIVYIAGLQALDWFLIISNVVSLALGLALLSQFGWYRSEENRRVLQRLAVQWAIVAATLLLVICGGDLLDRHKTFFATLPVVATLISMLLGSGCQFLENSRLRNTEALSSKRYMIHCASSALWCSYGAVKMQIYGWDESWTVCVGGIIGLVCYSAILWQIVSYRVGERRRSLATPQFSTEGGLLAPS